MFCLARICRTWWSGIDSRKIYFALRMIWRLAAYQPLRTGLNVCGLSDSVVTFQLFALKKLPGFEIPTSQHSFSKKVQRVFHGHESMCIKFLFCFHKASLLCMRDTADLLPLSEWTSLETLLPAAGRLYIRKLASSRPFDCSRATTILHCGVFFTRFSLKLLAFYLCVWIWQSRGKVLVWRNLNYSTKGTYILSSSCFQMEMMILELYLSLKRKIKETILGKIKWQACVYVSSICKLNE